MECGKPLRGRLDKKFCNDYCRNTHNNRQNSDQNSYVRSINSILRRNRRVLRGSLPQGEELFKCQRQKLSEAGFDFRYHTHQYTNRKGSVYTFCYEYGFLPLENDWLLLVRRNKD